MSETYGTLTDWGTLTDYATGEALRPAIRAEWAKSAVAMASGKGDAYTGAWQDDDGRSVYVDGGPDMPSIEAVTTAGEAPLGIDQAREMVAWHAEYDYHWEPRTEAELAAEQQAREASERIEHGVTYEDGR